MMPGLRLELLASGVVAIIVLFLMSEYLMLLLRVIYLLVQQQPFEDMRVKNVELMRTVYRRWKGAVLHLLCFLFWGHGESCHSYLSTSPPFLVTSGTPHILWLWVGSAVLLASPCFAPLWCVSVDPDQALVVRVFLLLLTLLLLKVTWQLMMSELPNNFYRSP